MIIEWFGHNRVNLSSKAIRGSGGVGVLIKEHFLLDRYVVENAESISALIVFYG